MNLTYINPWAQSFKRHISDVLLVGVYQTAPRFLSSIIVTLCQ